MFVSRLLSTNTPAHQTFAARGGNTWSDRKSRIGAGHFVGIEGTWQRVRGWAGLEDRATAQSVAHVRQLVCHGRRHAAHDGRLALTSAGRHERCATRTSPMIRSKRRQTGSPVRSPGRSAPVSLQRSSIYRTAASRSRIRLGAARLAAEEPGTCPGRRADDCAGSASDAGLR